MSKDARFEDGAEEKPLRLLARDAEDLEVLSSLIQDAVLPVSEIAFEREMLRFAMLINRFRWELGTGSLTERVQSMLVVTGALGVKSSGITQGDKDQVISILSIAFEPGEDGAGELIITLAGDGAIRCLVECLDVSLADVTRPYGAPSGSRPSHPVQED